MIVTLLFVVWLYSGGVQVEHAVYDDPSQCMAAGRAAQAKADASSAVKGAQFLCVVARPADKN